MTPDIAAIQQALDHLKREGRADDGAETAELQVNQHEDYVFTALGLGTQRETAK